MNEKSIKFVVLGDIGKALLFKLAAALLTSMGFVLEGVEKGRK